MTFCRSAPSGSDYHVTFADDYAFTPPLQHDLLQNTHIRSPERNVIGQRNARLLNCQGCPCCTAYYLSNIA